MIHLVKVFLFCVLIMIINTFLPGIDSSKRSVAYAQHQDVFNLDKDELPQKVKPDAPESEWITVEDRISYTVCVEKEKYEAKEISMEDIELWEIVDKSPFEWHQVDYYIEKHIVENHTRTFGKQSCKRSRKGTLFWLKSGKKCIFWSKWSGWDCRSDEGIK
ncbi:MAG: hypothetical protein D8M57_10850 [Candidatus Scalindua sp. AMX11]|nr:MAG: hypothetical protein DWQ00_16205 [Candidatus Scalindua sp.]NOG83741.1 hypothetical protein [Planctomycetota bacterium]RZV73813.1 MAG: hypothetical protein EX341_13200 [Candidatus Scalindua sp. SCAELEC01]TDE64817.1 MAG: hypothetical protein D8M57_10850 [Candidatus Scalindua sp. AMX11]GJQ60860.1 MAG: hypothetical protein SCALA701_36610 [Candidatus Scalindua sp.]